jgi:glycosyltransferase involved in cell wall biosynthesis
MSENLNAKISVIIAAYNSGKYLARTLDSVLRQTFVDWELIVIDDGSTDNTPELISQYANKDSRIRALSQTNSGCSSARNAGLAAMRKTQYVIFLDSDDVWEPDALEALYNHIVANPEHIGVYGSARFIDQDDKLVRVGELEAECLIRETYQNGRVVCLNQDAPISFNTLIVSCRIKTPGMILFRREAIDRVGKFDTSLTNAEDWDLYIRLSRYGTIIFLDKVVINYRVHSSNKSSQLSKLSIAVGLIRKKALESPENTPEQTKVALEYYPAAQRFFFAQKLRFVAKSINKRDWSNGAKQLRYAAGHFLRMVRGRP